MPAPCAPLLRLHSQAAGRWHPRFRMTEGLPTTRRILVATDFSLQAKRALECGRYFADHLPAKLVLLHVIEIFKLADVEYRMSGSDPLGILREQSQSSMADLKRSTPDSETHILEGSPRPLIVEFALESDCQMIVMGTQGRSGLAQLFLGSVAEYVVRHSKVPVLTIRT
jgi:nucleotide-binding universal stress UspA family protein